MVYNIPPRYHYSTLHRVKAYDSNGRILFVNHYQALTVLPIRIVTSLHTDTPFFLALTQSRESGNVGEGVSRPYAQTAGSS